MQSYVRPHLEYCVKVWSPYFEKDKTKLENVQKRALRMITNLRSKTYEERLAEVNLFSLKKRRLRGDLIEVFKIFKGFSKWENHITLANRNYNTRGHSLKIDKQHCRTDIRKHFFTQRVVNDWNSLPEEVVECGTIDTFKNRLDKYFKEINLT